MKETIIFDFGNVIANFDNKIFLNYLAGYSKHNPKELERIIYQESTLPYVYERGIISSKEFYKGIVERTKSSISKEKLSEIYSQIFTPIPENIELIRNLKSNGYRIGLLSNTSEWDYELGIKPIFKRSNLKFDFEILSYLSNSMKPDKKIYEDALSNSTNSQIYIDDIRNYVDVAESLGMKGVWYEGHEDLKFKFKKLGIQFQKQD